MTIINLRDYYPFYNTKATIRRMDNDTCGLNASQH